MDSEKSVLWQFNTQNENDRAKLYFHKLIETISVKKKKKTEAIKIEVNKSSHNILNIKYVMLYSASI